jgi:hypothetical protein
MVAPTEGWECWVVGLRAEPLGSGDLFRDSTWREGSRCCQQQARPLFFPLLPLFLFSFFSLPPLPHPDRRRRRRIFFGYPSQCREKGVWSMVECPERVAGSN